MNSDFALAVHCLVLLAHDSSSLLTSSQIAERLSVHPVRVRKTLGSLKKSGHIGAVEGAKGGFFIQCNPKDVTLDEIYTLTVSDVLKPRCHNCSKSREIGANLEGVLHDIFADADQHLQEFLRRFTLWTVLERLRQHTGKCPLQSEESL
ncbi:transcriptional regulator, BadM/Rrf2 family [Candidatus Moduliflexus flocculans]|uniref:Transcriptional regulator, BadM/Rrf2 family n=1 Tax=Candidatus Moduliflexus flocculans TaxID=1499966 RepID=A0A081BPA9_9BACT|nr:transcriptional regulator, BadM/Rrf2 family [Candidatus Moduliflexus flocculans]